MRPARHARYQDKRGGTFSYRSIVMATLLVEKLVQPAVNPRHLAYCPTMDLIALASIDDQISVYRLNGQRVFGITNKQSASKVNQITWKPNGQSSVFSTLSSSHPQITEALRGQSLAAAYDNSSLLLANVNTGKVVHQIDCSAHSKSQICCLGWGMHFTDGNTVGPELDKLKEKLTVDDMINQNPGVNSKCTVPDLPLDLALIDVEASLPKLSPLPPGGIESVPEVTGVLGYIG